MVAQKGSVMPAASKSLARVFGGLLGLCIAATVAHAADTPAYKEMPVDPPNIRVWKTARTCKQGDDPKAMLRGDAPLDPAVFDPFFNNILFPQFTLYKDTADDGTTTLGSNVLPMVEDMHDKKVKWRQSQLPICRHDFLTMFILQAERNPNQEPFNHLNALTIQAMRTIALGNYHPLSRYNAALLLSSLHEFQSEKPLKATLPALMACLESTDLVQVAALDGLLKQAKAGNVGAQQPQLVAALLKVVNQKTPPAGRTADGHDWIRRRAIDVLAALNDAGPNLAVITALDAILKDNQSSPELSCSAAKALGSIQFRAADNMNAAATISSIGQIAVDAYKSELAHAEDRKDAADAVNSAGPSVAGVPRRFAPAGALGRAQPGAANAPGAAVASHDLFISLPLLKSQLFALDHGLKGVVSAVGGTKNQQYADSVEKNLALLMSACDPNAADYDTLKNQISKAGTGLEAALASGPAVQGRAPAPEKAPAAGKEDSFDAEPAAKPAPAAAKPAVAPPAAKAAPGK